MDVNSHHISYFPNSILQLHLAHQSKMKGTLVSHQNLSSQSTLSIESTYKKSGAKMFLFVLCHFDFNIWKSLNQNARDLHWFCGKWMNRDGTQAHLHAREVELVANSTGKIRWCQKWVRTFPKARWRMSNANLPWSWIRPISFSCIPIYLDRISLWSTKCQPFQN